MQRLVPRAVTLVAIAALLIPSAAATWYTQGSHEPDNALDDSTLMRFDPPGAATDLIYFNAISGVSHGFRGIMTSPNSALLETRTEVPTAQTHIALLGVWQDCNGDGYIGMAEGAMREYSAELLVTKDVCPPVAGGPSAWTAGAHNYNGWVSELIPIGGIPASGSNLTDRRVYFDPSAMVWGDNGRPTDPTTGGTCALAPQPRGTYQSTGGFVNYVDCSSGAMERWNDVWRGRHLAGQRIPGLNNFGVDLGLDFDDPNNASGTWIDRPTFGSDNSDNSPAYVWDCSAPRTRLGDTLNETPLGPVAPAALHNANTWTPAPRLGNLNGATIPALVNHTIEGTNVSGTSIRGSADCDTSNDRGADFYGASWATIYVGEADFNSVSAANKRASNWNFLFDVATRGVGPAPAPTAGSGGPLGPASTPSQWNAGSVTLKTPQTVRTDIEQGTATIPPAYYLTFYAHVGTATTDRSFLTPGGAGVYASSQCGEFTSGIHNGWNCDKTTWYLSPTGAPIPEPRPLARPGQAYEFRDVDCYDGAIGNTGIGTGTPYYGPEPCAPASS